MSAGEVSSMKVFIDTNIMIDFLENRQPFASDAIRIFELSQLLGRLNCSFQI